MQGVAVDGRYARRGSSIAERLALHSTVDVETGCHLWTGASHDAMGYGRMGVRGRMHYVHRLAWELANGSIPDGLVLRHICDRPACINIAHLELGTQGENVADMHRRGRASERRGEINNSARLTWDRVRSLRADRQAGATVADLAVKYGISKSQIRNVLAGNNWKEPAA